MMLHVIRTATALCLLGPVIALAQDAPDLATYVGSYEQPNIVGLVRVRNHDGRLAAHVSGRPPIFMTYLSGHEFRPEGKPDWKVVFDVKDGRAVGYTFTSPEESNLATRVADRILKPSDPVVETRAMLAAFREDASIPGLSVAIAVHGNIVFSEAFGLANIESRTPATTLTRFRIASVSKSLTGVAAALLVERGELDLDAPITKYLPDYPAPGRSVTARQLAGHLSGIRHYKGDEVGSTRHYPTLQSALEIFATDDLHFEPGAGLAYTTYGYTVLGAVMEAAAGRDFGTLMRERIFEPFGMRHTTVDDQRRIIPNRSGFYAYDDKGGVVNAKLTEHSYKIPGGGFLSTAEDLVRFGSALLKPGLLKRETLDLVFGNIRTAFPAKYAYGMGWTLKDENGRKIYGHGGNQPGGRSYLLIYPDSGFVLAILANMYSAPIGRAEAQVIAAPFDRIARGISPQAPVSDPVGIYELKSERDSGTLEGTLRIWETGDRWTGSIAFEGRSMRLPMVAVSGNEIRCIGFDRRITVFELEVDGSRVTGTTTSGNRTFELTGIKSDPWRTEKENEK